MVVIQCCMNLKLLSASCSSQNPLSQQWAMILVIITGESTKVDLRPTEVINLRIYGLMVKATESKSLVFFNPFAVTCVQVQGNLCYSISVHREK